MEQAAFWQFGIFGALLVALAVLEAVFPRRERVLSRTKRWTSNFALMVGGAVVTRLLAAVGMVAAAIWAGQASVGLLNWIALPGWAALFVTLVLLDFAIWAQHVATHYIPPLWRLHRVHHTDLDLDVTSGARFHPIEIGLSYLWKALIVIVIGASARDTIIYAALLSAMSLFSHTNMRLPDWLDRALRIVIITPDFHRVHHSVHEDETNSNFGNFLSVWDRIFGTYRPDLRDGQTTAQLGLHEFRAEPDQGPWPLYAQPFRRASDHRQ